MAFEGSEARPAARPHWAVDAETVRSVVAGTLFLSAFLLFSVQPVFTKMVLPKLGGSPGVWAVSMCFFQAMLLLGYLYAHVLKRLVPFRLQPIAHLGLMALAALALPFGLPAGAEPPGGEAYLWLVGTLLLGVGLPFFAISANAPLLQSWFAGSRAGAGRDPYVLYGASNLGSLIALLSYPVLIEPVIGLKLQAAVWTAGFVLLGVAIAGAAGVIELAGGQVLASAAARGVGTATARTTTLNERMAWIAVSFVPSALLVSATNFITSDVASAPLLWVIPLALYLATFILAFKEPEGRAGKIAAIVHPIAAGGVLLLTSVEGLSSLAISLLLVLAMLFTGAYVCNRRLYLMRPEPERLTEFYLWMSFGGVLGGIFPALIAPQVFNAAYEFPLIVLAVFFCRSGAMTRLPEDAHELAGRKVDLKGLITLILVMTIICVAAMRVGVAPRTDAFTILPLGLLALLMAAATGSPAWQLRIAGVMVALILILPSSFNTGERLRSFFGIHRVTTADNGALRVLCHGTTLHGVERLKTADGEPVERPVPAIYYYPRGPIAEAVNVARAVAADAGATDFRAGVVGLGAGSMACNTKAGETWRYCEIDPAVIEIARNPKDFRFLSVCQPNADIVLGDARLTLAHEAAQSFDYLLIDAFSSDAVPVHLLTREAIGLYLDRLKPGGVIAMHLSNRHLDLVTVAAAAAATLPGVKAFEVRNHPPVPGLDESPTMVVVLTRSEDAAARLAAWPDAKPAMAPGVTPWTDDYSNILTAACRRYRGAKG